MKPNIYLDVDGVLVVRGRQAARHADEFLRKVLTDYPETTYWLTSMCNGDTDLTVTYIGHLFEPDVAELMKRIKPTSWQTTKTSAIDFSKPFLWFDDNLFAADEAVLLEHGVLASSGAHP